MPETNVSPTYSFTPEQMQVAWDEWGCNCGPGALAFALQTDLEAVRQAIPGFDRKRYTSPTMMKQAMSNLERSYRRELGPGLEGLMFSHDGLALVRVQWTGPWTKPGQTRWACRYTHWIVCWRDCQGEGFVFDINGGIAQFIEWELFVVPLLTKQIKRADGDWFPTEVWILEE